MIKFLAPQSTGKTRQLLTYAKFNNCTVICPLPARMKDKAIRYNLGYIECMSYDEFLERYRNNTLPEGNYVIDEMEQLVNMMFGEGAVLQGYDLTTD